MFQETKTYKLDKRTLEFAQSVRTFVSKLPRSPLGLDDIRQLVRSSGSIGANYIEASESLGKKDFAMRLRICRKEAKETIYWLTLLEIPEQLLKERDALIKESNEFTAIFGSIISKLG